MKLSLQQIQVQKLEVTENNHLKAAYDSFLNDCKRPLIEFSDAFDFGILEDMPNMLTVGFDYDQAY